jgi:hypothetical protein
MNRVRTIAAWLALAIPVLACPRCKENMTGNEAVAWCVSIIGMVLAPFVIGGSAFWYISRFGRKGQ